MAMKYWRKMRWTDIDKQQQKKSDRADYTEKKRGTDWGSGILQGKGERDGVRNRVTHR